MKQKLLFNLLVVLIFGLSYGQSTATYTVTFDSNWSNATHPDGSFPGDAHWSKLVGATHNDNVTFLEMGGIATQGIEDVAELGVNTQFFAEVNSAIGSGYANNLIDGDALGTALGQVVISDISTTEEHPLLTLVSMIAPSPDWMIAVNSVELLDGGGNWKDEIVIDLYPYDAGTDSGTHYNSANADVTPHEPISNLQGVAPFSSDKVGTLTVTLESVLGIDDEQLGLTISMFPNPAQSTTTLSSRSSMANVEVYNAIGQRVMALQNINNNEITLDLGTIASGVYLVKIQDTNNRETIKRLVRI